MHIELARARRFTRVPPPVAKPDWGIYEELRQKKEVEELARSPQRPVFFPTVYKVSRP